MLARALSDQRSVHRRFVWSVSALNDRPKHPIALHKFIPHEGIPKGDRASQELSADCPRRLVGSCEDRSTSLRVFIRRGCLDERAPPADEGAGLLVGRDKFA